jgi:hypothetical protein
MAAQLIKLTPTKTYKTEANAVKAVEKSRFGGEGYTNLTWFVMQHDDGRFFPVFIGERAIQAMVHSHFNVVG